MNLIQEKLEGNNAKTQYNQTTKGRRMEAVVGVWEKERKRLTERKKDTEKDREEGRIREK